MGGEGPITFEGTFNDGRVVGQVTQAGQEDAGCFGESVSAEACAEVVSHPRACRFLASLP